MRAYISFILFVIVLLAPFALITLLPDYDKCSCDHQATNAGDKEQSQNGILAPSILRTIEGVDRHNGFIAAWATVVIAIFTATLWVTSRSQSREMKRSVDVLAQAERAYICGGGPAAVLTTTPQGHKVFTTEFTGKPSHFLAYVNNYGKTPGELFGYYINFLDVEKDSDIPKQIPAVPKERIFYFRDWIKPVPESRPLPTRLMIPTDFHHPIVYGRFFYKDVITTKFHSSGFIYRFGNSADTMPILAPEAYTEEREETIDTINDLALSKPT